MLFRASIPQAVIIPFPRSQRGGFPPVEAGTVHSLPPKPAVAAKRDGRLNLYRLAGFALMGLSTLISLTLLVAGMHLIAWMVSL